MATELLDKRGKFHKVFETSPEHYRLVTSTRPMHYQKDGVWTDINTDWNNSANEFLTGDYPYVVKVNKGTRAITVLVDQTLSTIAPIGENRIDPTYSGNTITFTNLFDGVDVFVVLTAMAVRLEFVKTTEPCQNPQYSVTGGDPTPLLKASYELVTPREKDGVPIGPRIERVFVPVSEQYGTVTWDFSAVPVGVRVE